MQRTFADIEFNSDGTPIAKNFADVYFSNANGEAETHYVFLANNQLSERWTEATERRFVIAETGFGTGLNFLIAAQAFADWKLNHPNSPLCQLHFISTEKFPLAEQDWRAALARFQHLSLTAPLLSSLIFNSTGCQRMRFQLKAVEIVLDLWIGDAIESFASMSTAAPDEAPIPNVNAWFLDGFAPSKNTDMWQPELFAQMARLSAPDATFATFTAAGFVKRGLQAAGFCVEKRPGFGRKRDMLAGHYEPENELKVRSRQHDITPLFGLEDCARPHVVIVGAGIAGAALAYALARRNAKVTMICQGNSVADAASGNPQAGIYPQLHAKASILSRIQLASFSYARHVYDTLIERGFEFAHEWCGVLQVGFSDEVIKRQTNLLDTDIWPQALVQAVTSEQASQIAGVHLPYSGLYLPAAGWASPPELVQAMLDFVRQECDFTVQTSTTYLEHTYAPDEQQSLRIHVSNGKETSALSADALIFACGHTSANLEILNQLPFSLTRGQVETLRSTEELAHLRTVICHKGYLTPAHKGSHALGSTYSKNDTSIELRSADTAQNLATHRKSLQQCEWANSFTHSGHSRAAIRCSTPDHLPIVGAVPDNAAQQLQYANYLQRGNRAARQNPATVQRCYMLSGLGSRGFTTAPLMAERLVSELFGEPLPLSQDLLNAVAPNRFLLRSIKRGEDE
ncbi:bifunctional tRNA (5-methylaminomethyl-2-thiouridine)(34)-methyltransferase MnmD/FAD-dependent 5-carboxymethylaminomethyl-2-thiouridine(34) oxidoreductase MnmC [Alteromonas flava]|uniref:bifunctional tRNA (5-methylaminomethyl-2-thiouridine)(34)-methyltransferase MnmD/FAD-dependent 5-carboxymethylaminomethyl-2-thiouridine(34) oxidoreductase MnmC n=1 Tax=Alteromonas flava TaxID=2048003 RepID=UPI000C286B92|nr:bifunctional tRNA (5-methylaminomethyl-2-thiouridine)(34)-methyltransferase MnmD/FAD-dependent 5-carboxymethylaminomethyl-2-thiouridine(34) oxidoreductase MnmC [Alteromonas flava]